MNTRVCIVAAATACLGVLALPAQARADSEVWLKARVEGDVSSDLSLTYDQQFKWMERPEQLDRWQHTLTLDYQPFSWLNLGVGYRATAKPSDRDEEDVCCIHRPFVQAATRVKWKGLRLSLRLRGQTRHESGESVESMTRARVKLAWKALSWLRPYVSEETFWEPGADEFASQRLDLGFQFRPHESFRLGAFVRREFVVDSTDTTIYGANAAYRW